MDNMHQHSASERYYKLYWMILSYEWKMKVIDFLSPLANLAARLLVSYTFWKSGVLKLPAGFLGIGEGNWQATLQLFKYEYAISYIPADMAAYVATTFEIICPILLCLGLGTRIAAFILLIMTATIELTYQHSMEHLYWGVVLLILVFYGAGKLSCDHIIKMIVTSTSVYKEIRAKKIENHPIIT